MSDNALTNTIVAQADKFEFNGLFYQAAFERYFKNDWTGILSNRMGLDVHVVALAKKMTKPETKTVTRTVAVPKTKIVKQQTPQQT